MPPQFHRQIHRCVRQGLKPTVRTHHHRHDVRPHRLEKILVKPVPQRPRHILLVHQPHPRLRHPPQDIPVHHIKLQSIPPDQPPRFPQGLPRIRQPQLPVILPQQHQPPQGRHPHPEKLIQIRRVNPQKLQSLPKRQPPIRRLLQHPRVERKPTHLLAAEWNAVDDRKFHELLGESSPSIPGPPTMTNRVL